MGTKLVRREGLIQSAEGRAQCAERRRAFCALRSPLSAPRSLLSALRSPVSHLRSPASPPRSPLCALRSALCALILALLVLSCRSDINKPAPSPAVPQVRATVITIETTVQPQNKTFTHSIVIAGDKARSLDEIDQWRLFDLKANTVTLVDEIAKSYRTSAVARETEDRGLEATRETKPLQGVNATLWTTRKGGYVRQLWIGNHPAIPPQLFSMMSGIKMQGFPLAEHAELPYLNKKLVVDKTVTRIESKNVPASLFAIPAVTKPGANRRPAS